jgi:hypothetical protein
MFSVIPLCAPNVVYACGFAATRGHTHPQQLIIFSHFSKRKVVSQEDTSCLLLNLTKVCVCMCVGGGGGGGGGMGQKAQNYLRDQGTSSKKRRTHFY